MHLTALYLIVKAFGNRNNGKEEKTMKKGLAVLLAIVMLFAMVACAPAEEQSQADPKPAVSDPKETNVQQEQPAESSNETKQEVAYPDRPIQVIVPLGAGGDTDLCARLFSSYMEKELGVSIVVNNIKGAGGVTGSREVMNSAADGYTVLFYQYAGLVNMVTGAADFSYIDDFEVAGIGMEDNCYIWLANADSPYNSITELVEAAKQNPGKINIGLSGTGNMAQLSASVLEELSGADFNLVDLGSTSEEIAALLSGQISTFANYYSASKSYIESGDFKVLGVFANETHELLPDVPTMKEMGFETEFLNKKFYYYAFPKGTPAEFVDIFSAAMERVCNNPEAQKQFFDEYYITLNYMNPADSDEYMNGVYEKYNEFSYIFEAK